MNQSLPKLIDCVCGFRYLRTSTATLDEEIGHVRCRCGRIIGRWRGRYRLGFEAEDDSTPPIVGAK